MVDLENLGEVQRLVAARLDDVTSVMRGLGSTLSEFARSGSVFGSKMTFDGGISDANDDRTLTSFLQTFDPLYFAILQDLIGFGLEDRGAADEDTFFGDNAFEDAAAVFMQLVWSVVVHTRGRSLITPDGGDIVVTRASITDLIDVVDTVVPLAVSLSTSRMLFLCSLLFLYSGQATKEKASIVARSQEAGERNEIELVRVLINALEAARIAPSTPLSLFAAEVPIDALLAFITGTEGNTEAARDLLEQRVYLPVTNIADDKVIPHARYISSMLRLGLCGVVAPRVAGGSFGTSRLFSVVTPKFVQIITNLDSKNILALAKSRMGNPWNTYFVSMALVAQSMFTFLTNFGDTAGPSDNQRPDDAAWVGDAYEDLFTGDTSDFHYQLDQAGMIGPLDMTPEELYAFMHRVLYDFNRNDIHNELAELTEVDDPDLDAIRAFIQTRFITPNRRTPDVPDDQQASATSRDGVTAACARRAAGALGGFATGPEGLRFRQTKRGIDAVVFALMATILSLTKSSLTVLDDENYLFNVAPYIIVGTVVERVFSIDSSVRRFISTKDLKAPPIIEIIEVSIEQLGPTDGVSDGLIMIMGARLIEFHFTSALQTRVSKGYLNDYYLYFGVVLTLVLLSINSDTSAQRFITDPIVDPIPRLDDVDAPDGPDGTNPLDGPATDEDEDETEEGDDPSFWDSFSSWRPSFLSKSVAPADTAVLEKLTSHVINLLSVDKDTKFDLGLVVRDTTMSAYVRAVKLLGIITKTYELQFRIQVGLE